MAGASSLHSPDRRRPRSRMPYALTFSSLRRASPFPDPRCPDRARADAASGTGASAQDAAATGHPSVDHSQGRRRHERQRDCGSAARWCSAGADAGASVRSGSRRSDSPTSRAPARRRPLLRGGRAPHRRGHRLHRRPRCQRPQRHTRIDENAHRASQRPEPPHRLPLHAQACLPAQPDREVVLHPGPQSPAPRQLRLRRGAGDAHQRLHRLLQSHAGQAVLAATRRFPSLDFRSATEASLSSPTDPQVLASSATWGRILVTHDMHRKFSCAARASRGEAPPLTPLIRTKSPEGPNHRSRRRARRKTVMAPKPNAISNAVPGSGAAATCPGRTAQT